MRNMVTRFLEWVGRWTAAFLDIDIEE